MTPPQKLVVHKQSKTLEVVFEDATFSLAAEYLRVSSPSAEVKGHGPDQEVLQFGKQRVGIKQIDSVGNYAIKISFDDGHDSGIYSWDLLHDLGSHYPQHWKDYLERLDQAGKSRDENTSAVKLIDPSA